MKAIGPLEPSTRRTPWRAPSSALTAGGSDTEPAHREDVLRTLPASSWGAFAIQDLATPIRSILDLSAGVVPGGAAQIDQQLRRETGLQLERDLLSWMGGAGGFIAGDSPSSIFGGFTVETSDPQTTLRSILSLQGLFTREGNRTEIINRAGFRGFVANVPGQPQVGIVAVDDERLVAALAPIGLLDALAAGRELGGTEGFATADSSLGEDLTMAGFFDLRAIRILFESSVPSDPTYESRVKPFLEPLTHLVFGSKNEGDFVRDRLVIGVE